MKLLRSEIYKSFIQMGQTGMPVDVELYQIVRGRLADASLCGSHAQDSPSELPPPQERISRAAARSVQTFEIDRILAEEPPSRTHWRRYLVRWLGYDPEWERWRIPGRGAPGDPIETWEPHSVVKNTEALSIWKAMHENL